jgi:putative phosphoesterase
MRVGVISDTHGLLRPEAEAALAGTDHIVHAGDIGDPGIVPRLERIAATTAIRGNVDAAPWADAYPEASTLTLAGRVLRVVHDIASQDPGGLEEVAVLVFGHSHRPSVERAGGLLRLNPGSAGRRRFSLPVTLAVLELGASPRAEIVALRPTA